MKTFKSQRPLKERHSARVPIAIAISSICRPLNEILRKQSANKYQKLDTKTSLRKTSLPWCEGARVAAACNSKRGNLLYVFMAIKKELEKLQNLKLMTPQICA